MRDLTMVIPATWAEKSRGLLFLFFCSLILLTVSPRLSAELVSEARTIDGTGNNVAEPLAGAANTQLIRFGYFAEFPANGSGATMEYPDRPNARDISNRISAQNGSIPNARGLSDYIWQWGQFLTHDIDLTQTDPSNGTGHIAINDPADPMGPNPIAFSRSNFDPLTGTSILNPREQVNQITSFIDASNVYGSDPDRADKLRTKTGGRLAVSDHDLLEFNTFGLPNANDAHRVPDHELFLAGDIRANEQPGLTAMHTVFVREHNRLAGMIAQQNPFATDEQIYQLARKIVGAEMQAITYNEFLPALMGTVAPDPTAFEYDPSVEPDITQTFAHALFRFGHSMSTSRLQLVNNDGSSAGTLELRDVFFNPKVLSETPGNLDLIVKGLATQLAEENDLKMVDEIRNFLFGPPGAGGVDLMALDVQRGRDHGLPSYNETRETYGLAEVESVTEITSNPDVQQALIELYDLDEDPENIENLDLFVGALAEDHVPGTSVGILTAVVLRSQFTRLAEGDRFFYLNDLDLYRADGSLEPDIAELVDLDNIQLSDIIRFNTGVTTLQADVFFVPEPTSAAIVLAFGLGMIGLRRCQR